MKRTAKSFGWEPNEGGSAGGSYVDDPVPWSERFGKKEGDGPVRGKKSRGELISTTTKRD